MEGKNLDLLKPGAKADIVKDSTTSSSSAYTILSLGCRLVKVIYSNLNCSK